jgi:phosphoglycerate dehydrogenase-like enzyme
MHKIQHVVTNLTMTDSHWRKLCDALGSAVIERLMPDDQASLLGGLARADVAILDSCVGPEDLCRENLTWVHIDHAGLDRFATPKLLASHVMVTGSAGRSAPALAEHALLFMLALAYRLPQFLTAQSTQQWGIPDQDTLRGLFGRVVGIVGLGHTGQALASRCKAMGMVTLGLRRSAKPVADVDRLFALDLGDGLESMLAEVDFLVLCLPLTDRTHHLIGAKELAAMKPGAFIVNIARGSVIDEAALVSALKNGVLAGAGLDVLEREPSPGDAPIWHAPNLIITPHVTAQVPDRMMRSLDIIIDNIRRLETGMPLVNRLTAADVLSAR